MSYNYHRPSSTAFLRKHPMKLEVTFEVYTEPYFDTETGEEIEGDFFTMFSEEITGGTVAQVLANAQERAREYSGAGCGEVIVGEVVVNPRHIRPRYRR